MFLNRFCLFLTFLLTRKLPFCSLACRCAEKAREKGYTMFGLQFYGECWSGSKAESRYNMYGSSKKCFEGFNNQCDRNSEYECMGKQFANYIYELTEGE